MKFFVAALAVAAGVAAHNKGHEGKNTTSISGTGGSHVVYTTEIVTAYTTYCPFPTNITQGTVTYTVTEPTTLTITNCPCTIVTPVTTSTKVVCTDKEACTEKPPYPTPESTGGGSVHPTGVIPSKTGKPTEEPTKEPTKEPTDKPVTPVKPTTTVPIVNPTGAAGKAVPALAGVVGLLAAVL